jgi:hypothetical protein
MFSERTVGHNQWPPPSPQLTQPDLFLRGFLKVTVYYNNRRSLQEMKHNTELTVANTYPQTFPKVAQNTVNITDACLGEDRGHFQHPL